jgi:uncharacterized membrane protein
MNDQTVQQNGSYVFLRNFNVQNKKLVPGMQIEDVEYNKSVLMQNLQKYNDKIFDSNAQIYYLE